MTAALDIARREALIALLPAIYRQRDDERAAGQTALPGQDLTGPLRALIGVLAAETGRLEDDIRGLYDDWFIETCADWVVPYIGDLLGLRALQDIAAPGFSRRALVANTIAYRRGKGTARVIEQLAQDATGWRAVAREMFQQLATTQHLNHLRPANRRTPDLRQSAAFDLAPGPFGTAAHLIDVRSVALGRGRFNIPNLALFVWRLQAFRLDDAELTPAGPADAYLVNPAGIDAPLFNPPRSDAGTEDRSDARSVPAPLRRRAPYDELEARRQALAEAQALPRFWFDDRPGAAAAPVLSLTLNGVVVPPERLAICNLASWQQPDASRDYAVTQADGSSVTVTLPIDAAIDPERGRVRLAPAHAGAEVRLSHAHGFAGDIGAGPYSRRAEVEALIAGRAVTWSAGVGRNVPGPQAGIFATLAAALAVWRAQPPGSFGVIAVLQNLRFPGPLTGADRITVPEGSRLLIVGADWPALQDPAAPPGSLIRQPGQIDPVGLRPVILGAVEVVGTAPAASETPGDLVLDGLWLDGALTVADGHLGQLTLSHSTLNPGAAGVSVAAGNPALTLRVDRAVVGRISLAVPVGGGVITDSIVEGAPDAILAAETPLEICNATVFGATTCLQLEASGVIFDGDVTVTRRQAGCLRYCALPPGSVTPRRFRCQPDLALAGAAATDADAIVARLRPAFTAVSFGTPAYAQLAATCAAEITGGGEDGDEIGAWRFLHQPQRLANLTNLLPDYLPFGLQAGLFLET